MTGAVEPGRVVPDLPRPERGRGDLVSLAERVEALHALRLGLVCVVLLAAALAPAVSGPRDRLAILVLGYAIVQVAIETFRRTAPGSRRGITMVGAGVLLDALFLTAVLWRTGGPTSYLAFLVEVDVLGVGLLVSYRACLKLSLWYTGLLAGGHVLARAGLLTEVYPGRPILLGFAGSEFFGLLSFWMVAVATALFSSLNERELRRSEGQLRSLAALAAATSEQLDPVAVEAALLEHVCATFGMRRAAVVLDGQHRLRGTVADAVTVERNGTRWRWARGGALVTTRPVHAEVRGWPDPSVREAERLRRPVLLRRLGARDTHLEEILPGASPVVVVRVVAGGQAIGALIAEPDHKTDGLPARTVDLLVQFAAHAGLALRNASLHSEVQRLASTDALTGLANRRVLDEALEREVARAARRGWALSLVLFDVDRFKAVNDAHGHPVGDLVLQEVGAAIAAEARSADVAARFGGEEFALLLPDCGVDDAVAVAERVRSAIATGASPVPVTASAGVALLAPEDTAGALVLRADEALYGAKREGRDRVVVAPDRCPGASVAHGGPGRERARRARPLRAGDGRAAS